MPPRAATEEPPVETAQTKTPPPLPNERTKMGSELHQKMTVIYGPPGVGKSTLASQWAGGGGLFFNCAGELGEFEVFQVPVLNWTDFRAYSWAVSEEPGKYPCGIIDTADTLGRYCSETVRAKLGITHESELDFGIGYQSLRDTFSIGIAKLAALGNFGVIYVAHADEKQIKTRSAQYDKWQIRGVKSVRDPLLDMADLVLFVDFAEQEDAEFRVIKTKPSRYWDAKERGISPRLPSEIVWPIGENGWDIIKALWDENAPEQLATPFDE